MFSTQVERPWNFRIEIQDNKKSLRSEDLKYFVRGRNGSLNFSRLTATTPDEAQGGCVTQGKGDDFDQDIGKCISLIRNQYPCSSQKASFHCLKRQLHWKTPCEIHGNSVQAEVAQAAKRQFRELRRTFRIFSLSLMCSWVPEKNNVSDFRRSWTVLQAGLSQVFADLICKFSQFDLSQLKSSQCVIQLMMVRSIVLLVLDACGVLGNLLLAFFAIRILAFGQDKRLKDYQK